MLARFFALTSIALALALAWAAPVAACGLDRGAATATSARAVASAIVAHVAAEAASAPDCAASTPSHDSGVPMSVCDCMALCAAIVLPTDGGVHLRRAASPIEPTPALDLVAVARVPPTPPPRHGV